MSKQVLKLSLSERIRVQRPGYPAPHQDDCIITSIKTDVESSHTPDPITGVVASVVVYTVKLVCLANPVTIAKIADNKDLATDLYAKFSCVLLRQFPSLENFPADVLNLKKKNF